MPAVSVPPPPVAFDRSSTASRVADYLRAQIGAGSLAPGARISELAVSAELGVSRSPVREAIAQLAQERLVEVLPYRGAFVRGLDADRLEDLLEFRLSLELFAVARAVAVATPEDFDRFEASVEEIRTAARRKQRERAIEADLRSHEGLIRLARNEHAERAFGAIVHELRLYIRMTTSQYARLEELADEHAALLRALRNRDGALAESLLRAHIMHGYTRKNEQPC
jgi:DNA-binding GntR family transcriptional regulator